MSSKGQDYSEYQPSTHHPRSNSSRTYPPPPPLPPRASSYLSPALPWRDSSSSYFPAPAGTPPPYRPLEEDHSDPQTQTWTSRDPRSSSTQSLLPSPSGRDGRRKLLLVYIHGFMGTETSFQSFPAHVHNVLSERLKDTHVVHTKIYPRYKSKKAIEFARNDFSNWLAPHESPETDVILVGHSMGGLLSAEVVLLLRHRIIGTINLDTPFLGMHPGVVVSGIASLFRPGPDKSSKMPVDSISPSGHPSPLASPLSPPIYSTQSSLSASTLSVNTDASSFFPPQPTDPNYNPSFPNDVKLAVRKGWESKLHFVLKHQSEGIRKATKEYVMSHMEFGGCMADYPGLKARYHRVRALEEPDLRKRMNAVNATGGVPRVRFVNYYTASTGVPKRVKDSTASDVSSREAQREMLVPPAVQMHNLGLEPEPTTFESPTQHTLVEEQRKDGCTEPTPFEPPTPEVSVEESQKDGSSSDDRGNADVPAMEHIEPSPLIDSADTSSAVHSPDIPVRPSTTSTFDRDDTSSTTATQPGESPELSRSVSLPPIPALPSQPPPFDATAYSTKDERKLAEKEYKRLVKAYDRAVKDREKALKDRAKLQEKREKNEAKEYARQLKLEEKERREAEMKSCVIEEGPVKAEKQKKKRDRKFCMLPPKDANGDRDPTWVRIYMEGVDEVGAHCGLFFLSETYEKLVLDVAARVAEWIGEEAKGARS